MLRYRTPLAPGKWLFFLVTSVCLAISRVQGNAGRIWLLINRLFSPIPYQCLKDNAILGT